jgi:cytochrome c556
MTINISCVNSLTAGLSRPKKHRLKKTGMSADTFAKLYRSRSPLDADTAKKIAANIAAADKHRLSSPSDAACGCLTANAPASTPLTA